MKSIQGLPAVWHNGPANLLGRSTKAFGVVPASLAASCTTGLNAATTTVSIVGTTSTTGEAIATTTALSIVAPA